MRKRVFRNPHMQKSKIIATSTKTHLLRKLVSRHDSCRNLDWIDLSFETVIAFVESFFGKKKFSFVLFFVTDFTKKFKIQKKKLGKSLPNFVCFHWKKNFEKTKNHTTALIAITCKQITRNNVGRAWSRFRS